MHLSDKAYGAKERRVVLKKTEKKIIKINKIRKYLVRYVIQPMAWGGTTKELYPWKG